MYELPQHLVLGELKDGVGIVFVIVVFVLVLLYNIYLALKKGNKKEANQHQSSSRSQRNSQQAQYNSQRSWTSKKKAERQRNLYQLHDLADRLDWDIDELRTHKPSYETKLIPKASGGKRTLYIPDDTTKAIQKRILHRLLKKMRVHPAATAYRPNTSVRDNALLHVGKAVIIKTDIKDFFPRTEDLNVGILFEGYGWDDECVDLLTKLTTWKDGLPQGAPTSPALSNLVNYILDDMIDRQARKKGGTYTRYSDDITVSFKKDHPRRVRGMIQHIERALDYQMYEMNHAKTHILRQHQRMVVTGIVVNEKANLPRAERRKLRAMEHRLKTTGECSIPKQSLEGKLAWNEYVVKGPKPKKDRNAFQPTQDSPRTPSDLPSMPDLPTMPDFPDAPKPG